MILAGEQARFVWVRDNFEGEAASEIAKLDCT